MRTVYSSNLIPTPSPDVEMVVDAPEIEEVTFILVTNQKSKKKTKVSSSPPTDFRTKTLLVLRAPPLFKTVIASSASKPDVTCSISAIAATMTLKPA